MADTVTSNYGWVKPEPGASNDTWGAKLNANFDAIDAKIKTLDFIGTAKATPVTNDRVAIGDSAASNAAKYVTFGNLRTNVLAGATWDASAITSGVFAVARIPHILGANGDGYARLTNNADDTTGGSLRLTTPGNFEYAFNNSPTFTVNNAGILTMYNTGNAPRLRLTDVSDASETSTDHALQIGPTNGVNLRMDANEILTVNNGAAGGTLFIPNGINLDVPLVVASGGTGAGDAATARSNLGTNNAANLTIGTLPNARLVGDYSFANLTLSGRLSVNSTAGINFANDDTLKYDDSVNTLGLFADSSATPYGYFQATGFKNAAGDLAVMDTRQVIAGNGLSGGGDLSANRTFTLGTPGTITGSTTNTVTTTSHTHAINLVSGDITGALGYTPVNPTLALTAGNGLTGGGTLAANRTFTLGTPSDITNTTTNSVTTTSHTHALGFIAAEVSTTTSAATTSFPLGHMISMYRSGATLDRNASATPAIMTTDDSYYVQSGQANAGTALTGTWRCRGHINDGRHLMQRIA